MNMGRIFTKTSKIGSSFWILALLSSFTSGVPLADKTVATKTQSSVDRLINYFPTNKKLPVSSVKYNKNLTLKESGDWKLSIARQHKLERSK